MRILLLLAVVGLCACTSNVESGRSENEVVTRKSTLMKGQTGAQNGDSDYCNNSSQLCNAGEGDCDSNLQCASGLVCLPNFGPRYGLGASVDICAPAHCANRIQDSDEAGADCGGSCAPCAAGVPTTTTVLLGAHGYCNSAHTCSALQGDCDHDSDCNSGLVCVANTGPTVGLSANTDLCMLATCHDRTKDGNETAVDCGGSCAPCAGAKGTVNATNGSPSYCTLSTLCAAGEGSCASSSMCQAGLLCMHQRGASFGLPASANVCLAGSCDDGMQDNGETAIDCGGPCGTCVLIRGTTATCTNGIEDGNETGVDCGGSCPSVCPTCTDGIQNEGETGVDCGGPCSACATCSDHIQNEGETGIDCGGSCAACPGHCTDTVRDSDETGVDCGGAVCPACPTCTDGIQNEGEVHVDCGGPCAACPSCADSIQNQGETGLDCGGPCAACAPTCSDGVQNEGETGVDCGGPCTACVGQSQPCYDGAAATRGVGACHDGTQTYQANHTWSACSGEQLPVSEVCGNAVDENCDGSAPACSATLNWADRFGGAGEEIARSAADPGDGSGDVIIGGTFTSRVDFGTGPVSAVNGRDAFVVRLDATGKPLWQQYLQGTGDQFILSVAANHATNRAYATGYFYGKFTVGATHYQALGTGSAQDIFIVTYDLTTGAPINVQQFGDAAGSQQSFEVAASNNVLAICGQYRSTVDFGGGSLATATNQWRSFVAAWHLDAQTHAPTFAFQTAFSQADATQAGACRSVDISPADEVAVGGNFKGDITIGANHFVADDSNNDGYTALFNSSGSLIEAHRVHGTGDTQVRRVRAPEAGFVTGVGYFRGQVEVDSDAATIKADNAGAVTSFLFRAGGSSQIDTLGTQQDTWLDFVTWDRPSMSWCGVGQIVETDNAAGGLGTRAGFQLCNASGATSIVLASGPGDQNITSFALLSGTANGVAVGSEMGASTIAALGSGPLATMALVGGTDAIAFNERIGGPPNTLVSADSGGTVGNAGSDTPAISAGGEYVVFESTASNLVSNDTNGVSDIFGRSQADGSIFRISVDSSLNQATGPSYDPALSTDGTIVAYASSATNLVANDTNGHEDIFAWNSNTSAVTLISVDSNGNQGNDDSVGVVANVDGTQFAFTSRATNLAANPNANGFTWDVFFRDVNAGTTIRMSADGNGNAGNGASYQPAFDPAGPAVAFTTEATNILTPSGLFDFNNASDVVLFQSLNGGNVVNYILVSQSTEGWQANAKSAAPAVSANSKFVVFESWATNLVTGLAVDGTTPHIYLRDVQNGFTELVDEAVGGGASNTLTGSFSPHISSDGRFVSFWSDASNLVANDTNNGFDVFVVDRLNHTTRLMSVDQNGAEVANQNFVAADPFSARGVVISYDGKFVAFDDSQSLVTTDTNGAQDVYESTHAVDQTRAPGIEPTPDNALVDPVSALDARIQVALATVPTGNVTLTLTSDNTSLGTVSPASITFTPGNATTPQNVTVTPVINAPAGSFHVVIHVQSSTDADYAALANVNVNVDSYWSPLARVSVGDGVPGAQGTSDSADVALSDDGRFVAFDSASSGFSASGSNGLSQVYVRDRQNGTTQCLSLAVDGSLGNASSSALDISASGRYVLLNTVATNLGPPGSYSGGTIFRADRRLGILEVVSVDESGVPQQNAAGEGALSGDGRFAAFQVNAALASADTNGKTDIYLYDAVAKRTTLVSRAHGGGAGDSDSYAPSISLDGRFVTFMSSASDLVAGDTNGKFDVFVYDVVDDALSRVNLPQLGGEANDDCMGPQIDATGRHVWFYTTATNLIPSAPASGTHMYQVDLLSHAIDQIDVAMGGGLSDSTFADFNGDSRHQVSADGQYVLFVSDGSDLQAEYTNNQEQAFVRDTVHGVTQLLTRNDDGFPAHNESFWMLAMSGDGRVAGFDQFRARTSGDTNNVLDVYVTTAPLANPAPHVHASPMGITATNAQPTAKSYVTLATAPSANVTLSVTSTDPAHGTASPSTLTFTSGNWNVPQAVTLTYVGGGDVPGVDTPFSIALAVTATTDANYTGKALQIAADVYTTPNFALVSANTSNHAGDHGASDSSLYDDAMPSLSVSDDGRYVAFDSRSDDLIASDGNSRLDVFVRDTVMGVTSRVSTNWWGGELLDGWAPQMSADGQTIAWMTSDRTVIPNIVDVDGVDDIYVQHLGRDTWNQAAAWNPMQLVTMDTTGVQAVGGLLWGISADGTRIVFSSAANSLVANDTNGVIDVFVRDTLLGTTTRASVSSLGAEGSSDSDFGAISGDGRYVTFLSASAVFDASANGTTMHAYVHDLMSGITTPLDVSTAGVLGNGDTQTVAVNSDGRFIAFASLADNLTSGISSGDRNVFLRDTVALTTTLVNYDGYTTGPTMGAVAISADGDVVAFGTDSAGSGIGIANRTSGLAPVPFVSNGVGSSNATPFGGGLAMSPNGRFVAFTSSGALAASDANGTSDVYLNTAALTEEPPQIHASPALTRVIPGVSAATLSVALSTAPTADVTVSVASSDPSIATVSPASLTFTPDNWAVSQPVTVTGMETGVTTNRLFSITLAVASTTDATYGGVASTSMRGESVFSRLEIFTRTSSSTAANNWSSQGQNYQGFDATGRYFVFSSLASNLVAGDTNNQQDIFVRDRQSGILSRVDTSASGAEANDGAVSPAISGNARYVVFASDSQSLIPTANVSYTNIYRKDLQTGAIDLVASNDGDCGQPSISYDGNLVAFVTNGPSATGDGNGNNHVLIHDMTANTTVVADVQSNGNVADDASAAYPRISSNGMFVAFESTSNELAVGAVGGLQHAYRYSVHDDTVLIADVSPLGYASNQGVTSWSSISGDGRYIAYQSTSTNLVPEIADGLLHAYVYDCLTGTTQLVDYNVLGNLSASAMGYTQISDNGRYVIFGTCDPNFGNNGCAWYLRDLKDGTTSYISSDWQGNTNLSIQGGGNFVSISADGSYYEFDYQSGLTPTVYPNGIGWNSQEYGNAAPVDTTLTPHIDTWPDHIAVDFNPATNGVVYVSLAAAPLDDVTLTVTSDDTTGTTTTSPSSLTFTTANWSTQQAVTVTPVGFGAGALRSSTLTFHVSATGDAAYSAVLDSTVIVANETSTFSIISQDASGRRADGNSYEPSFTDDGRYVLFTTYASNLGASGHRTLVLKDRHTGAVSVPLITESGAAPNNDVFNTSISADGRYLLFVTDANNVLSSAPDGFQHVYQADTLTNQTILISCSSGAVPGDNSSGGDNSQPGRSPPSMSADGRFVAFVSDADNFTVGGGDGSPDVFVRDTLTGTTELVSFVAGTASSPHENGSTLSPFISANGRYVVYVASGGNGLITNDACGGFNDVYVYDRFTQTNTRVSKAFDGSCADQSSSRPVISGDGRYIAYASYADNLVGSDANGQTEDIFVYDQVAGSTYLAPIAFDGSGENNGVVDFDPYTVAMSVDGQYLLFESYANNLDSTYNGQGTGGLYVRDLIAGTTNLLNTINGFEVDIDFAQGGLAMSGDGTAIAFGDDRNDYTGQNTTGNSWLWGSNYLPVATHPAIHASPMTVTVSDAARTNPVHVKLLARPQGNVTLTVSSSDSSVASLSPATLTFTPANWSVAQDVTVTMQAPTNAGDTPFSIRLSTSSSPSDAGYASAERMVQGHAFLTPRLAVVSVSSAGKTGRNGGSEAPSIDDSGQYVAFDSSATDLLGGAPTANDVYVHGPNGTVAASWRKASGNNSDGPSYQPVLSADALTVAFVGTGTLDDQRGYQVNPIQAYVNTRPSKTSPFLGPELVSLDTTGIVSANGDAVPCAISGDGRYVLFTTLADNMVPGTANGVQHLYMRDRYRQVTELISQSTAGLQANNDSGGYGETAVSADGRFVAFTSYATNLDPAVVSGTRHVYLRDRMLARTRVVDVNGDDTPGDNDAHAPAISANGEFVAYLSNSSNLWNGTNGAFEVYVRDFGGYEIELVSANLAGHASQVDALTPSMSADGRFVAFISLSSQIVAGDTNSVADVFVRDRAQQTTALGIFDTTGGLLSDDTPQAAMISGNGAVVAVTTNTDLLTADQNGIGDVYTALLENPQIGAGFDIAPRFVDVLRDGLGRPVFLSLTSAPSSPVTVSITPSNSAVAAYPSSVTFLPSTWNVPVAVRLVAEPGVPDGTTDATFNVTFTVANSADSNYANLAATTISGATVHSVWQAVGAPHGVLDTTIVPANSWSMDNSGRYVVFASDHSDFVANDTNNQPDVFLEDRTTGAISRISVTNAGAQGTNGSYAPSISGSGRYVVFVSAADLASPWDGTWQVYERDLQTNTNTVVSLNTDRGPSTASNASNPRVSDDGSRVVFTYWGTDMVPGQIQNNGDVFVRDMHTGTTVLASPGLAGGGGNDGSSQPQIAGSGSCVVYYGTADNLVPGDTNSSYDAFLYDMNVGAVSPVSVDWEGKFESGASYNPSVSANCRYVAFDSYAALTPNVLAGGPEHVYVRDMVEGTIELVDEKPDGSPSNGAETASFSAISDDGRFVAFYSGDSRLVPGVDVGWHLFVRDLVNHSTTAFAVDERGLPGPSGLDALAISGDGEVVGIAESRAITWIGNQANDVAYFSNDGVSQTVAPRIEVMPDVIGVDSTHGASTAYVSLSTAPASTVTVTVSLTDTSGMLSVSPVSLTFTPGNYGVPQPVNVTAAGPGASGSLTFHASNGLSDITAPVVNATPHVKMVSVAPDGETPGDSSSLGVATSKDGRYVAFISYATNLVPGSYSGAAGVFVRDTQTNTTTRVLANDGSIPQGGDAIRVAMSADGTVVIFSSQATNLVSKPTYGNINVFAYDRVHGGVTLVSADASGNPANNSSGQGGLSVSGDGRFVAFESLATNFSSNTLDSPQIYVSDRLLGTTTLIGLAYDGGPAPRAYHPAISEDGHYVAFSSAAQLTATPPNSSFQVYRYNLESGAMELVSADAGGAIGDANSGEAVNMNDPTMQPAISADGRYVMYQSTASNLVTSVLNHTHSWFVTDMVTGTTANATYSMATLGPIPASGALSSDGQFAIFATAADVTYTGCPEDRAGGVFMRDLVNNTTSMLSIDNADQGPNSFNMNHPIALSGDGTASYFSDSYPYTSIATGFPELFATISPPSNMQAGIQAWPMTLTLTQSVPSRAFNVKLNAKPTANVVLTLSSTDTSNIVVSAGATLTFTPGNWGVPQQATLALVGMQRGDVVVPISIGVQSSADAHYSAAAAVAVRAHSYLPPMVTLASRTTAALGNGASQNVALSDDGTVVAFESVASNLVSGDSNGFSDIFVGNVGSGSLALVSRSYGQYIGNRASTLPLLSGDGNTVAFTSTANNLIQYGTDTNSCADVFVTVRSNASIAFNNTDIVSATPAYKAGNGCSTGTSMSADGRLIVFQSTSTDLVAGDTNGAQDIFVRDRYHGTTQLVSASSAGAQSNALSQYGAISADGRYVAFESSGATLVAGVSGTHVFLRDLVTRTTVAVDRVGAGGVGNGSSTSPSVSGDGRYVAFTSTATNLGGTDANGASDVFVRDTQTNTTMPISLTGAGATGNGASSLATISQNGQFVAFVSSANNLVAGDTNSAPDIFVYDLIHQTMTLYSTDGLGAAAVNTFVGKPAFSGNSSMLAFDDRAALLTSDTNALQDVYVVTSPVVPFAPKPLVHYSPPSVSLLADGIGTPVAVALSTKPSSNVTINLASSASTVASLTQTSLVFTPANWNVAQAFVVNAPYDASGSTSDQAFTITGAVSSTDVDYKTMASTTLAGTRIYSWVSDVSENADGTQVSSIGESTAGSTVATDSTGRYVVFVSANSTLVGANGNNQVYLHDRTTGQTSILSVQPDGSSSNPGCDPGNGLAISADARYVAFACAGALVPGVAAGWTRVYKYDRQLDAMSLEVFPASGGINNIDQNSLDTTVSDDGRRVAFDSYATTLAVGDTNNQQDVFVHDDVSQITTLLSKSPSGAPANSWSVQPRISGDGSTVVFASAASNLVVGDVNGNQDVFSVNVDSGIVSAVSFDPAATFVANSYSVAPTVSRTGRYVAFISNNVLTPNGNPGSCYVRDMVAGWFELVDENLAGYGSGNCLWPHISEDGRFVVFYSSASGLTADDINYGADIFVRDLVTHTTTLLTHNSFGAPLNGSDLGSYPIALSGDASNYVDVITEAFAANDTNGIAEVVEGITGLSLTAPAGLVANPDAVYVDLTTGLNGAISVSLASAPTANVSVSVTNNESTGALTVAPASLVFTPGNWNTPQTVSVTPVYGSVPSTITFHVSSTTDASYGSVPDAVVTVRNKSPRYLFDSINHAGALAQGHSFYPVLSFDGRYVAFDSYAANLVSGDNNHVGDVFVRDSNTGIIVRANVSTTGGDSNAEAFMPSMSSDGRYITFCSQATNLVAHGAAGTYHQVYERDLVTGATWLVSAGTGGAEANGEACTYSYPSPVSDDGRFVVFTTRGTNFGVTDTDSAYDVFVRDNSLGVTLLVSGSDAFPSTVASGAGFHPSISRDGRYIAYEPYGTMVSRLDQQTGENQLVSVSSADAIANAYAYFPAISGDGKSVAFVSSATNLAGSVTTQQPNVFVRNISAGTTTLVSVGYDGVSGNSNSSLDSISDDGQYILFHSNASNIARNASRGSYFIYDTVHATTTTMDLLSNGLAPAFDGDNGGAVSGDGRTVAFVSQYQLDPTDQPGGHYHIRQTRAPLPNHGRAIEVSPGAVMVPGGYAGTLSIKLGSKPAANVVLGFTGDLDSTSPSTLTFTTSNWNVAQTVDLTLVPGVYTNTQALFEGATLGFGYSLSTVNVNVVSSSDATYAALPSVVVPAFLVNTD